MNTSLTLAQAFASTLLALAIASPAAAAVTKAERDRAAATFRTDMANCKNGTTQQTRSACLHEARAAYGEARRGVLGDATPVNPANKSERCMALQGRDRDACMDRMQGMGKTTGTAAGGGIYRELTTVRPARPAASAPR